MVQKEQIHTDQNNDKADPPGIAPANRIAHWQETRALAALTLFAWFIFAFAVHILAHEFSQVEVFGFTPSFYMAAQGSLIFFILLIFWFAFVQDRIDRKYGVEEDE